MGPLQSEKYHAHFFNSNDRVETEPFCNPEAVPSLSRGSSSVLLIVHFSGHKLHTPDDGKFHET